MALIFFLDPEGQDFEKAVLFGRFRKNDEKPKDFRQDINFKRGDFHGKVVLPILPGDYRVILGLKDPQSERSSLMIQDVCVPDYWNRALALGNFIVTDRVEEGNIGSKNISALDFGQVFAYPMRNSVFKKSDTLNILYHIYNASTEDGRVRLSQQISLQSNASTYRLPDLPLEREISEGQVIVSGFPIPLAQIDAGEYELFVKISDQISGEVAEVKKTVVIEP
jgi:hypothetical protein